MKITEKVLYLYDKIEEIAGILYDLPIPDGNSALLDAITDLWTSFNSGTKLTLKLEDD